MFFRVSEEDARALEGNLTIELPKELMEEEKERGNKESELRVKLLTSLNARECLLRLTSDGQIIPGIKARTMDYEPQVRHKDIELKSYENPVHAMPVKFDEHAHTAQQKTERAPVHTAKAPPASKPMTLNDFLSSQSSSPDKVKRK